MQEKNEKLKQKWNDQIENLTDFHHDKLNEWEANFIDSIQIQLSNDKMLSMKQSVILNRIHERYDE